MVHGRLETVFLQYSNFTLEPCCTFVNTSSTFHYFEIYICMKRSRARVKIGRQCVLFNSQRYHMNHIFPDILLNPWKNSFFLCSILKVSTENIKKDLGTKLFWKYGLGFKKKRIKILPYMYFKKSFFEWLFYIAFKIIFFSKVHLRQT